MTNVAIIIVHYNSDEETLACLESLNDISTQNLKVTVKVLDNASKSPFEIHASKYHLPVEVLRSDTNLGFTSGNNFVMRQCLSDQELDFVLLLNSDTVVQPDFLKQLVQCAEAHPAAGIVTPKIYFAPGREYHKESYESSQRGQVIWFAGGVVDFANFDAFHKGVDELDLGQHDQSIQTEFATGCCMLVRRATIEKVGMFDARYFLYLEDVDWCLRMRQLGFEIWYCPEAAIWHVNAGSSGGAGSPLHTYYQTRNRLFFFLRFANSRFRSQASLAPAFAKKLSSKQRQQLAEEEKQVDLEKKNSTQKLADALRYYAHLGVLAWQLAWTGSAAQAGVIDWLLLRFGKRAVV